MSHNLLREAAQLREIEPSDAAECAALSGTVGWPHRPKDWEMAIGLGHGVVARLGVRIVGTALWWPYGDQHATLGMIIVAPAHQGAGLGSRMMQELFAQVRQRSLLLNATQAGIPLYARCGFVASGAIDQHQGEVLPGAEAALGGGAALRRAHSEDLPSLERLDEAATRLQRGPLLEAIMQRGEAVALARGGDLVGYSMLRRSGRGFVIGPVVAQNDADAQALVAYWLADRRAQFVRIDVPKGSRLTGWLTERGLKPVDRVISMTRGGWPAAKGPVRLHALASQSLG